MAFPRFKKKTSLTAEEALKEYQTLFPEETQATPVVKNAQNSLMDRSLYPENLLPQYRASLGDPAMFQREGSIVDVDFKERQSQNQLQGDMPLDPFGIQAVLDNRGLSPDANAMAINDIQVPFAERETLPAVEKIALEDFLATEYPEMIAPENEIVPEATPAEENLPNNTLNDLTNFIQGLFKKNTVEPKTVDVNTEVASEPTIQDEIERMTRTQKGIMAGGFLNDAANYLGELFRGPSVPFTGAAIDTFTPTPSQRERQLAKGSEEIAGQADAMLNFMREHGQVSNASGLFADEAKALTDMQYGVATAEMQRQASDNARRDEMRAKQSLLDMEVINKNIEKQMQENAASGQVLGALEDRMLNTMTDMNRLEWNKAKMKEMFKGGSIAGDYFTNMASRYGAGEVESLYGNKRRSSQRVREEEDYGN